MNEIFFVISYYFLSYGGNNLIKKYIYGPLIYKYFWIHYGPPRTEKYWKCAIRMPSCFLCFLSSYRTESRSLNTCTNLTDNFPLNFYVKNCFFWYFLIFLPEYLYQYSARYIMNHSPKIFGKYFFSVNILAKNMHENIYVLP